MLNPFFGKTHGQILKGLIGAEGINTQDIKNLSVAALLTRLATGGKNKDVREKAAELREEIHGTGLGALGLDNVLGEWLSGQKGASKK